MPRQAYSPVDHVLARMKVHPLGCWEFTGPLHEKGYGRMLVDGRHTRPHRVMYEDWFGPIPDGLTIDHLCLNKRCVNPAHLEAVTRAENTLRAWLQRPLPTHCRMGHPYDNANTYVRPNGKRRCRICVNAYHTAWRARQVGS